MRMDRGNGCSGNRHNTILGGDRVKKKSPLRAYIEDRVIWPYPGTVIINIHRNKNRKSVSVYLANSWMLFVVFGCQQDNGEWYLHLNEVNNLAINAYNEWQKNRYKRWENENAHSGNQPE